MISYTLFPRYFRYLLVAGLLGLGGCKKDYDDIVVSRFPVDTDQEQVLSGLADIESAIVSDWLTATTSLQTAVATFTTSPAAATLQQAQAAWKAARNPWENNESFGFGPVGTDGIDASSDDWPFDITAFTQILNSTIPLNEAYITQMATATKGFHAIEYLLFGLDGTKTAANFTPREFQLLTLLTADLDKQATRLNTSWAKGVTGNFYASFSTAGEAGSSYARTSDALGEVLGSMVDIMTELPDSKIAQPLTTQNSAYAESRFSDYSLTDYRNNINGVYTVYVGQYGSVTAAKSLSDLIAAAKPEVDDRIKTQFKLCLALIDLIQPVTFNQAITTRTTQLQSLQTELRKLNQLLDTQAKPLLGLD